MRRNPAGPTPCEPRRRAGTSEHANPHRSARLAHRVDRADGFRGLTWRGPALPGSATVEWIPIDGVEGPPARRDSILLRAFAFRASPMRRLFKYAAPRGPIPFPAATGAISAPAERVGDEAQLRDGSLVVRSARVPGRPGHRKPDPNRLQRRIQRETSDRGGPGARIGTGCRVPCPGPGFRRRRTTRGTPEWTRPEFHETQAVERSPPTEAPRGGGRPRGRQSGMSWRRIRRCRVYRGGIVTRW